MRSNSRSNIGEIAWILARSDDPRLIEEFLRCLLTRNELEEIDGRWELVKRLAAGESQRRIARELAMSLCKITRGSRELKKEGSAFKRVLNDYYKRDEEKGLIEMVDQALKNRGGA